MRLSRDTQSPPWRHPTLSPAGLKVFLAINDHDASTGPSAVVPCANQRQLATPFAELTK